MSSQFLKVTCGQCQGRMRVERTGESVACPHCGAHLRVPEEARTDQQLELDPRSGIDVDAASRSGTRSSTGLDSGVVPRKLFLVVSGYACAVTLGFLWLLLSSRKTPLESLPDLRPLKPGEVKFVGYETELPADHVLQIGQSRRFGDVLLTPVKVSLEPVEFEHYADPELTRTPTEEVLKVWLRFQNVSETVSFPPYDVDLMSRRAGSRDGQVRSNSFLCLADKPRSPDFLRLNFEHAADADWNLKQQNAATVIAPGEKLLTYCASDETGPELVGHDQLRWRLQFRKGVNVSSKNGVTTLVDVVFTPSEISSGGPQP